MTEHQKETAFLRKLILFDDSDARYSLENKIAHVQREERCVRRVGWLLAILASLSVVGLGYGIIFQENFLYGESPVLAKVLGEAGLASLIALVPLFAVSMSCRGKLNDLRQECRTLITGVLTSRLGQRDSALGLKDHGAWETPLLQLLDTPFKSAAWSRTAGGKVSQAKGNS